MITRLFENFIDNHAIYRQNEQWWTAYIERLFGYSDDLRTPLFLTRTADGTPFYNGNPMYSVLDKRSGRAMRLIQDEPEVSEPYIQGYIDRLDGHQAIPDGTLELVIILELTNEALPYFERLFRAWFIERCDTEAMQALLDRTITVPA